MSVVTGNHLVCLPERQPATCKVGDGRRKNEDRAKPAHRLQQSVVREHPGGRETSTLTATASTVRRSALAGVVLLKEPLQRAFAAADPHLPPASCSCRTCCSAQARLAGGARCRPPADAETARVRDSRRRAWTWIGARPPGTAASGAS
jgi:hypothetical protein